MTVFTEFYHDPTTTHLVGNGTGSAGTSEGVEHEVAGFGCNFQNTL